MLTCPLSDYANLYGKYFEMNVFITSVVFQVFKHCLVKSTFMLMNIVVNMIY